MVYGLTTPGQTEFTRMGARSTANPRVRLSTAPITPAAMDQVFLGFTTTEPIKSIESDIANSIGKSFHTHR